ncbi:Holliday junction resolvase RuvX [Flaviflexus salsibiostraticola]|uniref:Putative pre-16S rRNA nuclease n=1 Tax=Flaviflexus salsibiostraticola TaxID=1282737 RepID=A0A3Q8WSJ0_9ACTO|nr:Holliday junction resolvase RuvX [Flaviflexus salsibiostraticola]AZN29255.1 Holliday junction resolvase RuvX [Flaviflexus salsibiostraticola]
MRRGVRLAFDVGRARIGVAACDAQSILCTPVETLYRDKRGVGHLDDVDDLIDEYRPIEIIVGLPKNMDGTEGMSARDARKFARQVALRHRDIAVRLVDERLTTVSAHRALHESGRSMRSHRAVVDQVSAVLILELALEIEEKTGEPAGEQVSRKGPDGGHIRGLQR